MGERMGKTVRIKFFFFIALIAAVGVAGVLRVNLPYADDSYREGAYRLHKVKAVLDELEKDRMIYSARITSWILTLTGYDKKLHGGVYQINNRMTTMEIIGKWVSGEQMVIEVTIKEGDDLFDIAKSLTEKGIIAHEGEWFKLVRSREAVDAAQETLEALGMKDTRIFSLEGWLFPDTYYLYADDSPRKLIDLALKRFKEKVVGVLPDAMKGEEKLAAMTMASLVEKETSVPEERVLVASVISNRLRIKMKLRFDPTVIYALKTTGQYYQNFKNGFVNIKKEHYGIKSPFNTYYIKGLPPAPISSFSLPSLRAVLKPAQTEYLFFVAKERGNIGAGHYFAKSYEEHLMYLQKMLAKR